ncbi:MAG TPA: CapA family protein, partial [Roseomonas sp.]
ADPMMTPVAVYRQRTSNDTKGFPSDRRFWESVLPVCHFDGRTLAAMEIHPVTLGLGEAAHRRGRPRLATGEEGAGILRRFAALSEPFGTRLRLDGDRAWLDLGG